MIQYFFKTMIVLFIVLICCTVLQEAKGFKPDMIHINSAHLNAITLLTSGIYSLIAMSFDDDTNKKAHLYSRIVVG